MTTPHRIDDLFARLKKEKRKALVAYLVAGDPDLATTAQLVPALVEAGADIIELGIPFSDPLADGIVNQLGCQRAIESGTTLPKVLQLIAQLRQEKCQVPLVLFTYYNPVFAFGREKFEAAATHCRQHLLAAPPCRQHSAVCVQGGHGGWRRVRLCRDILGQGLVMHGLSNGVGNVVDTANDFRIGTVAQIMRTPAFASTATEM